MLQQVADFMVRQDVKRKKVVLPFLKQHPKKRRQPEVLIDQIHKGSGKEAFFDGNEENKISGHCCYGKQGVRGEHVQVPGFQIILPVLNINPAAAMQSIDQGISIIRPILIFCVKMCQSDKKIFLFHVRIH